jgi:hypothetical protein
MVAPGCPLGRPGLRPVFFRSDFGAGLPSPSDDGGREEFFEFCFAAAAQVGHLRPEPAQLSGRIGHKPHYTTAGPP